MLQYNEELDSERDGLDVQRVDFVDARSDAVVLTRVFEVTNAVALPFLQENNQLLACTTAWDGQADQLGSRLDV